MVSSKRARSVSPLSEESRSDENDVQDWTTITDVTKRRRLQNLAAQRAWRETVLPRWREIDMENERQQTRLNPSSLSISSPSSQQDLEYQHDTSGNVPRCSACMLAESPDLAQTREDAALNHFGLDCRFKSTQTWEINLPDAHLEEPVSSQYVRPPLDRPMLQVRLLYLKPGTSNEPLACSISVWDLRRAPAFSAISYTWGDASTLRSILINEQPFVVRKHCHYALLQARSHYPASYVWIDSICIDQENMEEKGQQVKLMGEIYAKATAVLACIGPHDDSSLFVQDALQHIETGRDIPVECTPWTQEDRSRWQAWAEARNFTYLTRLCWSYERLMHRGYWSRLWIVQELVGGGHCIQVLCGESILDWWAVRELGAMLHYHKDSGARPYIDHDLEPLPTLELWEFAMAYHRSPLQLVLFRTKTLQCATILDRIYGIMNLVEWPPNHPGLIPNYSKTPVELAVEVIELIAPTTPHLAILDDLLRTLELDNETFLSGLSATSLSSKPRPWRMNIFYALEIETLDGRLVVYRQQSHRNSVGSTTAANTTNTVHSSFYNNLSTSAASQGHNGEALLTIYDGESFEEWGFACSDTRPGDILVASTRQDLIVREGLDNELRVVGAAAAPDFSSRQQHHPSATCKCAQCFRANLWDGVHLQMDLDIRDAVVLAGGVPHPKDRLLRLAVPQVGTRIKAVTGDGTEVFSLSRLLQEYSP